jgi:hypothetical protein
MDTDVVEDMLFGFSSSQDSLDDIELGSESEEDMLDDGFDSEFGVCNLPEDMLVAHQTHTHPDAEMLDCLEEADTEEYTLQEAEGIPYTTRDR